MDPAVLVRHIEYARGIANRSRTHSAEWRSLVADFLEFERRQWGALAVGLYHWDEEIQTFYPFGLCGDNEVGRTMDRVLHQTLPTLIQDGAWIDLPWENEPTGLFMNVVREGRLWIGLLAVALAPRPVRPDERWATVHATAQVLAAVGSARYRVELATNERHLRDRQMDLESLVLELEERQSTIALMHAELAAIHGQLQQVHLDRERILSSVPSSIATLDARANIVFANPSFQETFGDVKPGDSVRSLFSGVNLAEVCERVQRCQRAETLELSIIVHGQQRFYSGSLVTLANQDQLDPTAAATVLVLTDVTGPRQVATLQARANTEFERAQDLATALEDLEKAHGHLKETQAQLLQSRKLEAIGMLSGGIAHDFNNILCAVSGYANLIMLDLGPGHPSYVDLSEIVTASERGTGLTRQLLAFSRKQILQPVQIFVDQVVGGMEHMLTRLIGEDIQLRFALSAEGEMALFDPTQLEQVLLNLVVNAREAMPKGGEIVIDTRRVEQPPAAVQGYRTSCQTASVCVSVRDTGKGMSEQVLERVFEPFFTTAAPDRGTGLGLATVYGVVKQSGSSIHIHSTVGVGTQVDFYIPIVEASAVDISTATSQRIQETSPPPMSANILLVEDDPRVRRLARRALTAQGHVVMEASDGVAGLELANTHLNELDLVISDVVMPRMNGRELADAIRRVRPDIRVLFMSGYTEDAMVRTGVTSGTDQLLQKPFTLSQLAMKVRSMLE
jgi:signal transduction histidine kinase/CheY-like chemotaxis protein